MRLKLLLIAAVAISSVTAHTPEYKDHTVTGVNREQGRATFWYYDNYDDAKNPSYLNTGRNILLNGDWAFSFAERPADRVANFYEDGFDTSTWDRIEVPGSWPLQGYDKAIYLNHPYEFNVKTPFPINIPDEWNPVGSYRRDFEIPANWSGERIVLHFGAVKSSFYVWVNGNRVGYSQDSKMQAEFDITPYVRFGEKNNLSVEVYRFSAGSYLEGQDMWRLAGIKRDVWIYPTPKSYVADLFASTTLGNDYRDGMLDLNIDIKGKSHSPLKVELFSADGERVFSHSIKSVKEGSYNIPATIPNCSAWSDEHPNLYTLVVSYNDSYQGAKIGFRSVELKDSQVLINGKAVRIKGVNRHEHHPKYGHYVPNETTAKDIRLMKEFNINAIRTSHYPNDPYLYELADEAGIYICDEANVETHGLGAALQAYYDPAKHIADNSEWETIFHDRIFRMVERDKNHPSVIFWSMGNECGDGSIFRDGYDKLRAVDPSRLVMFEQAGTQRHTDVVCPMYMTLDKIENYARSNDTYRPLILAEYQHAMGNSMGNFADYWALFDRYPNLQGGFIWDWVDQGLEDFRDGERFFNYGGAFGLEHMRNDGAFCLNGVVNPDRVPNPHAYEMRKVHDNIDITRSHNGGNEFVVWNKNNFTKLSYFDGRWELLKDGVVVESGELNVECEPNREERFVLPIDTDKFENSDYHLNFTFSTHKAENMLERGHVVATEQIELKQRVATPHIAKGRVRLIDDSIVKGTNFNYIFDKESGRLLSMEFSGEEFLRASAEYDFSRVRIDNDGWDKSAKDWRSAHKRMTLRSYEAKLVDGKAIITATNYIVANEKSRLNGDFTTKYTIHPDGVIEVDNWFIPTSYHAEQVTSMPRLGERYQLRGDLGNLEWYGRGEWENYADRKTAAFVGRYAMAVEEFKHHYINPQESGNRCDVRSFTLSNDDRVSLTIEGKIPLMMSASHYPKENYYTASGSKIRNSVDLKRSDDIFLNVDFAQQGVGGDNSWGNPVHVQYRVIMRAYNYGYYIKPSVK